MVLYQYRLYSVTCLNLTQLQCYHVPSVYEINFEIAYQFSAERYFVLMIHFYFQVRYIGDYMNIIQKSNLNAQNIWSFMDMKK